MSTPTSVDKGDVPHPSLPPEVAGVYGVLFHQLAWARYRWQAYTTLFNHSQRRIDLLNESASFFFFLTQETLFDSVYLGLVRMGDPAATGKFENATLARLHKTVEEVRGHITPAMQAMHDEIQTRTKAMRVYRDKLLAHLDLTQAINATSNASIDVPLPLCEDIEELLVLWAEYLNGVKLAFGGVPTAFEATFVDSDANALVGLMKQGHRYEALVMAEAIDIYDNPEGEWSGA